MDGDPHIRQRRREAHKKLVQSKQMNAVKTADAVVTNPTEIAVAIKYDESKMAAPIVVAKGWGRSPPAFASSRRSIACRSSNASRWLGRCIAT